MVDSVYGPARALCDKTLTRFDLDISYYDPLVGADVAELLRHWKIVLALQNMPPTSLGTGFARRNAAWRPTAPIRHRFCSTGPDV